MRTIVIGDIHGCYNELKKLISDLITENVYNHKKDKLIFLGDYIDRGDDSRLVVKFIRSLQEENKWDVVALMGNHEDMALEYFAGDKYSGWTYNGYEHTLKSYEGHDDELLDDLEWMKTLPLYYEDDNFIYVHAGINKRLPMDKQLKNTLLWTREAFLYDSSEYDKRVIFGHTPTYFEPYYSYCGNDICIDTGCVYGGSLTALVIEDGKEKEFYSVKKEENSMKTIRIMAQAFYGNNVITEIDVEDVDRFILGYLDKSISVNGKFDRTIVEIPNTDGLVILYNKYREEEDKDMKVLARIPDKNLEIHSRCIACRIDADGNLASLKPEDDMIVTKYLVA